MKYRKKAITVDAVQFTEKSRAKALDFIRDNGGSAYSSFDDDMHQTIVVDTLEGESVAALGDWIIQGVLGEFYPCNPDVFDKTYVKAGDGATNAEDELTLMHAGKHHKIKGRVNVTLEIVVKDAYAAIVGLTGTPVARTTFVLDQADSPINNSQAIRDAESMLQDCIGLNIANIEPVIDIKIDGA